MIPVAKKSPINIHCLFDPDIADGLEDRFFGKLNFEYNGNKYSATERGLIRLGRDFTGDQSLSDEEALKKGISQYVISLDTLSDVFKKDSKLREKTIIAVSNNSKDGASGLRSHSYYFSGDISQLEATRRAIYQLSDMIFSSNDNDKKYFLGEGPDSIDVVKEKCRSLKPCIHGCDAHTNKKVFAPDGDRFCWIKADPTFEGLKQVLYEPKDRVHIGGAIPDRKPEYYVINKVTIEGNEDFSPEPLYFSDQLTCIIGGKSTGKSLLLNSMAAAIDEEQATAATKAKPVPQLKVYWRDGACSDGKGEEHKIVYIPQTYLNRLSDEEQETTEIDTIIQEIILQNETCKEAHDSMQNKISRQKQQVSNSIISFLQVAKNRKELHERCKEIGGKEAIKAEVAKLKDQLEKLSREYNVTEAEMAEYQSSVEEERALSEKCSAADKEIGQIQGIQSVVEIKLPSDSAFAFFKKLLDDAVNEVKAIADEAWAARREQILQAAREKRQGFEAEISKHKAIIGKLQPKMEGNERISKLSDSIVAEQERLRKLAEYQTQLSLVQSQYQKDLSDLSQSFSAFRQIYLAYKEIVNSSYVSSADDLKFSVNEVLRANQLSQKILGIFDNRSMGRFGEFILQKIEKDELASQDIEALIEAILGNSKDALQLKGGHTAESALREILSDWYNVDYIVRMDNDNIRDMSPGKKALVLLRLLISLAESRCPILIDQPEDDLDNRSIFDELIRFIKEKKTVRQIIVVTHNANIVLGGDAELVIVANQDGKNAPNKQCRFEYRGGSIEDNKPVVEENGESLGILNSKGIQEHICEILEGGEQAFALRQHKYRFIKG